MTYSIKNILKYIIIGIFVISCDSSYIPKSRGYPRINLPNKHEYQTFDKTEYPYKFNFPTYSKIEKDTVFFNEKTENPFWINIVFPSLNAIIYISYKPINAKYSLNTLLDDAFEMTYFHTKRADYINPIAFENPEHKVYGLMFDVGGASATSRQFYVTDSLNHFLRGALYFNVTPNADSLAPVNQFLEKDIKSMMESIEWK